MMFAGGGLFLSMVATTIWISGDVTRMREEERAKEAQKCAMAQAETTQAAATTTPTGDFSTPPADPTADACAGTEGGTGDPGSSAQQIDPATGLPVNAGGAVDPVTGQPVTSQAVDPATGAPLDASAGAGEQPAFTDPAASAQSFDPAAGQPMADPAMAGATTDPAMSGGSGGF